MVKLLYQDNPYMKECRSRVVDITNNEVLLEQSCFFAFSGGQASDSGTINNIPVKEAFWRTDEIIYVLENVPGFKIDDEVTVKIDWEKRHRIMKLHTAAHIVYEFFIKKAGNQKVIGSNISLDKARLDFEYKESVGPLLKELEEQSNKFIAEDKNVLTYPDEEDEKRRWWEIKDFAKMPCGGTHVKKTAEIGKIKLKRKNLGSNKERIEVILQ